jgi:hypothetical protein
MPPDTKRASADNRLEDPASYFQRPSQVVNDSRLSLREKNEALNTWEQDALQLLTASNEGMTASDNGGMREAVSLSEIVRARETIAESQKSKPAR